MHICRTVRGSSAEPNEITLIELQATPHFDYTHTEGYRDRERERRTYMRDGYIQYTADADNIMRIPYKARVNEFANSIAA